MNGRTISHYRVERGLGAGGMGEVYLAHDLALGRPAALKLLPEGFTPELRTRLLHEARTSARLQHPAIATFYEAGEADGVAFIAMEYVQGLTLRERLATGPLPADQALAVTACILGALAHAHAAGILHRDIKPENIMLTGAPPAKLLDFGLAKALASEAATDTPTATALTADGFIAGTVGYMAPEQLRGEPLDARADVFAIGTVLYEAISGRPAFPGATPTERLAAILSRDPIPLTAPGLTRDLWPALARALARDPARRYPSAAAFLSDLNHLQEGGIVGAQPDTLAVLDLQNLSGDPADNWLGSGMAESLTTDLARVPGLTVIARERVVKARAALPGGGSDPVEVGLMLGCGAVLSGSFQKMGPALRVTTHLTEIPTGRVLSTEKVDGRIEDVFQIQDRLAQVVVASLNLIAPAPGARAPALGAYECYARGRRLFQRMEKGTMDQARELYEQAIAQDPTYAPALAALAGAHALRYTFTSDPAELATAEGYARRAIQSDPKLGEPHVWLSYALLRQERVAEALESQKTAIALDPTWSFAPYFAAAAYLSMGRPAEALPFAQKAVELGPTYPFNWLALGWAHLEAGHLPEARWTFERTVESEKAPGGAAGGYGGFLAETLRRMGALNEARTEALAAVEAAERSDNMYRDVFRPFALCALARTALQQGDMAAARAAFGQAASHSRGRPRVVGGGQLLVQALAGLARSGEGEAPFAEAVELFERRQGFNFQFFYGCVDHLALLELSRAAQALGRTDQAPALLRRAREAGSREAEPP